MKSQFELIQEVVFDKSIDDKFKQKEIKKLNLCKQCSNKSFCKQHFGYKTECLLIDNGL